MIDLPRRPIPFWLGWACALSPYIALFVVIAALARQPTGTTGSLGELESTQREMMRPVFHVGWSLSMMFAAYVAGPLWVLLLCIRRCRFSWKVHALQAVTLAVGWLLFWMLIVRGDALSKIRL